MKPRLPAVFSIVLILLLLFPHPALADEYSVRINEYLPVPPSGQGEWVELYNPEGMDLSSWWIDDDEDFTNDDGSRAKKQLSSLVVTSPTFPYQTFSSSLYFFNNDGDSIVLFSATGTLVDNHQYSVNPGENVSIGRAPNGSGDFVVFTAVTQGAPNPEPPTLTPNSSPIPTVIPSATPSAIPTSTTPSPTSTPSPTPSPSPTITPTFAATDYDNIQITEVFPYPDSGPEWVEFRNNNNYSVNLQGWQLDDLVDGGKSPVTLTSFVIPAWAYAAFDVPGSESGGMFNNSGLESVRLVTATGVEKSVFTYSSTVKGKSWSLTGNTWCQTDPTKGSLNLSCPSGQQASPTSAILATPTPTDTVFSTPVPTRLPTDTASPSAQASHSAEVLGVTDASLGNANDQLALSGTPTISTPKHRSSLNSVSLLFVLVGLLC